MSKKKSKPPHNNPHSQPHQHNGQENERNVRGDIHVHGKIETDFPPDLTKKHDTEREEDTTQARKNYIVQISIAIAVSVYALLTFWQGWLTRESIKNSQENFTQENAPVIWVTPDPPTITINEPLKWNVHYKNYGHSTALSVHSCITAAYGPKGFNAWDEIKFPSAEECRKLPMISNGVSPPDFTDYTTVLGDKPLTASDISTITNTDGGALVYGLITYDDIAGHSYESAFCAYRLRTGAIMHCEKYNYIKRAQ